jgi:LysR family transcriptional regulator, glycine cleavage system transcriptional activator
VPSPLHSLDALRVFAACARELNFTRAAEELGMTQAAVSQRMRLLEERLGRLLFHRTRPRLQLTEAGAELAGAVAGALFTIQSALERLQAPSPRRLRVTTTPAFAARWLAPRLPQFQAAHPGVSVELDASPYPRDLAREGYDLAIRSTASPSPAGMRSQHVAPVLRAPFLSPGLANELKLSHPSDLLTAPLIADDYWEAWLTAAGSPASVNFDGRARYDSQQVTAEVAAAGGGVALLSPVLFADFILAGRLVQAFPHVLEGPDSYRLIYPVTREADEAVAAFASWILDAACADD